MLEIKNYSNFILKDISFDIDKNLIILGNNGAGKTTLARVLSGIILSNCVKIDNLEISDILGNEKTKLINYIPSYLEIFDEYLSVFEFLELSTLHSKLSIDEILMRLQITYLKDKPCKHLSSGESQLVLMASAILHNAKYTILDEPTSNLDPKRVQKIFHLLRDSSVLNNKIIITHNLNLAYQLGYKILFIEDGNIKFHGNNKEFFSESNLENFFDDSVKKINNSILVNL